MNLATHTLKNGQVLTIIQPGAEYAAEIVAHVNQVIGESDHLAMGAGEFGMSVEDEAIFLNKMKETGLNLFIAGIVDGKIVSVSNIVRSPRPRIKHVADFGISVQKKYWGLGVCKAMMSTLIAWSQENSVRKINLKVKTDNIRAIEIYEKAGFKLEGVHPREMLINGKFHDELSMGLLLDEKIDG